MKIELEKNPEVIYMIMTEPEIWERITDDSADLDKFMPPNGIYLTAVKDGEIIGLARFTRVNSTLYEYHPMVLKKYRHHSVEFHDKTVKTIKNMISGIELIAYIPECFKDVIFFARRNGWERKGKVTQGIVKHGKRHDIHILQYEK